MISNYRREPSVTTEEIEYLLILIALYDEVAHGDYSVFASQIDLSQERDELVVTAVYVTDDDCAAHCV